MADKINLGYDENYEATDSEDDLTQEERQLIEEVRRKKNTDEISREVFRFDASDEDVGGDDDVMAYSDIEDGEGFDGIPDEKAWGKRRSAYYHTDFVDQDYSTYNEKEEELAQQEEEEAKAIQQRLAKQLNESDFNLDIYSETQIESVAELLETSKTKLTTDFSQLSARQKQQLFEKDSPEFTGLVQDFEKYSQENATLLSPILKFATKNDLKLAAFDFVQTRSNLILIYCTNIGFYLVLKSKRIPVKNHPIVKRLVQLRQLLTQLEESFEKIVRPQLEPLLERIKSGEEISVTSLSSTKVMTIDKKKRLNILKAAGEKAAEYDEQFDVKKKEHMESSDEGQVDEMAEIEDDDRRGITYQIAKNKGLTPHRKKENRNPRVKHRNKFRKALIRRKGAVRTVRKELTRYGGELTGIKANVKKGIKLKS